MKPFLVRAYKILSSFPLAVSIIFGMFVATLLGTLAQQDIGLFRAQQEYFESIYYRFPREPLGGFFAVPLPGGMLLMSLLAVNLILGGIVRLKKTASRVGILVMHLGILFMLVAGWVKFAHSTEGAILLYEGGRGSEYVSYHDFEVTIAELGTEGVTREWAVPSEELAYARGEGSCSITSPDLPFRLTLTGYARNANVLPSGPMFTAPSPVVDGYFIREMEPTKEAEANAAACYATIEREGAEPVQAILWAYAAVPKSGQRQPFTVRVAERVFLIDLDKRRYPLPFEIELTKFTHERLPGTSRARHFQSDVIVRTPGETPQPVLIRMNEPLRRGGIVAYQSSYGPEPAPPGARFYSILSVVENPSDHWPEYALYLLTAGMLLHFGAKLWRWVSRESMTARPGEAR